MYVDIIYFSFRKELINSNMSDFDRISAYRIFNKLNLNDFR